MQNSTLAEFDLTDKEAELIICALVTAFHQSMCENSDCVGLNCIKILITKLRETGVPLFTITDPVDAVDKDLKSVESDLFAMMTLDKSKSLDNTTA